MTLCDRVGAGRRFLALDGKWPISQSRVHRATAGASHEVDRRVLVGEGYAEDD
jgi:hypothetical protein